MALAAAAFAAAATKLRSNDLWWHLASGRWILAHGSVPRADPFTFTSGGTPWIDHGWLWQLAAIALERSAGVASIALLKIAACILFVLLAWIVLRRAGWEAHAASVLVLLCLAVARFRFADRPEGVALGLLALFLFLLVSEAIPTAGRAAGAAAVCVLWANVHASVLIAPVLAGAAAAGSLVAAALASLRREERAALFVRRARTEGMLALVGGVSILLNPYGYRLALVPFRLRAILANPKISNPEWPPPALRDFPIFYLLVIAVFAFALWRVARRIDPSTWRGLFLAGTTAWLALGSLRHVGIFCVTLPFAAAAAGRPLPSRPRSGEDPSGRRPPFPAEIAPLWGIAAVVLFLLVPGRSVAPPGFGVESGRFPVEETDWVERTLDPPRRMYNDVAMGGYLIWRLYPGDQAFIDGRNEVHARLLAESAGAVDNGRAWQALLDRYDIQAAMVQYRDELIEVSGPAGTSRHTFAPLHFPRSRWALVQWGDGAMVFLRRGGRFQAVIDRGEYSVIDPEDWRYQLDRCADGDTALCAGIRAELQTRMMQSPVPERAVALARRLASLPQE